MDGIHFDPPAMNDLGNEAMEADYQQVNYFDFLVFLIFFVNQNICLVPCGPTTGRRLSSGHSGARGRRVRGEGVDSRSRGCRPRQFEGQWSFSNEI